MTKQQLEVCINEFGRDIYSFCKHLTCNQQEADDLYQDTFLKAAELSEKLDFQRNPKSYLVSIALRTWKNKKRKYAWRKRIADTREWAEELDVDCRDFAHPGGNGAEPITSGKKFVEKGIGECSR